MPTRQQPPASPAEFPAQRAWERVSLLHWARETLGDAERAGGLRELGVARVEDVARVGEDSVVRSLELTPTKAQTLREQTNAQANARPPIEASPCGADGCGSFGPDARVPQPDFDFGDVANCAEAHEKLLNAAISGSRAECEAALAVRGVDVNYCREDETTALMWAAMGGHRDLVEMLCDNKATDIDRAVSDPRLCIHGWTAFAYACDRKRTNCAVALLHAGANWELSGLAEPPEMPAAVRDAIAECELLQRCCRARQRLAFARGSTSGVLARLPEDLLQLCTDALEDFICDTPFARRVLASPT